MVLYLNKYKLITVVKKFNSSDLYFYSCPQDGYICLSNRDVFIYCNQKTFCIDRPTSKYTR